MGRIAKALNSITPSGLKRDTDLLMVQPWASGRPQYPPRNYFSYAVEGFAKNELVYACIAALAQSADEVRLVAEQRVGDEWVSAEEDRRKAPVATECQRLLDEPNPLADQFMWTQDLITFLHIAGNSYNQVELTRSSQPAALWNLRPDRVRIIPDAATVLAGYEHEIDGTKKTLLPQQVVHHRLLPDPLNPMYGLAPLAVLARAVDGDNNATDYVDQFFKNMGSPAWVAITKGKVGEDQKKAFKRGWKEEYGLEAGRRGTGGAGGMAVIDGAQVDLTRLGAFPGSREMGLLDVRKVPEARVCAVFRVHPQIAFSILGFLHPTYAQANMAESIFWTQTLLPLYRRITGRLTLGLRVFYGPDVRVNIDTSQVSALQEDEQARRTFWLETLKAGGITRETFLDKIGLPGEQVGTYLMPSSILPEGAKEVNVDGRKFLVTAVSAGGSDNGDGSPFRAEGADVTGVPAAIRQAFDPAPSGDGR